MSTYATVGGYIVYAEKKDFESAVSLLGSFVDSEGYFLDEMGERIGETAGADASDLTIIFPLALQRNLASMLLNLFVGGKGTVVWTTTDCNFQGGVIVNGEETLYDLTEWAEENDIGESPAPDPKDAENWNEYSQEIEQEFFAEFL